jgi:hypothetical protein
MLKLNQEKLLRRLALLTGLLILVVGVQIPRAAGAHQTQAQYGSEVIKDGIGLSEIVIGTSVAADVEARYGKKYELINKNDYSYRMDYAEQGLAFYYCLKDQKKRIFLVELHHGVTGKGVVVGTSTVRDVERLYGKRSGGGDNIYEYPGIQFYLEPQAEGPGKTPELDRKVVEVDIVPPDKASNFCD